MVHPVLEEIHEIGQELLDLGDREFVERFPELLEMGMREDMMQGLRFKDPGRSYSRKVVAGGEEQRFTILAMKWAPGFYLLPHEHHGRPCIDYLISGTQEVTTFDVEQRLDDLTLLRLRETVIAKSGEVVIVKPWESEVHEIRVGPRGARSLHCYPQNASFTFGYTHVRDGWYRRSHRELKTD